MPKLAFVGADGQLFVIPFAKSATTGQHSPVSLLYIEFISTDVYGRQDNTRYAFLQMDDRALVYRGADQPDMSVINPESDVWQHIKVRFTQYTYPTGLTMLLIDSPTLSRNELAHPILLN